MPLNQAQTDLFARFRFDYPDDVKRVDGVIAKLTALADAYTVADAAYAAAGLGAARSDLLWGTGPAAARYADAVTKQARWRDILDDREAFSAGAGIGRHKTWTTERPVVTSHDTITVTSLDGGITYVRGEETPILDDFGVPTDTLSVTGDYILRLDVEDAPSPNQNILVAVPGKLPAQVVVRA